MILKDLERRNSRYFAFPNSIALLTNYVTVVENKPVMSVNIVSQLQSSSTFGHARSLSKIGELLVQFIFSFHYIARIC